MQLYFATFALAAISAFVLSLLVRWGARRLGVMDSPDDFRKIHGESVPLLGGVAIFGAFFFSLLVGWWWALSGPWQAYAKATDFSPVLYGATLILLLGVLDDAAGIRPILKLLVEAGVAVGMWCLGYRISGVNNPFGPAIELAWLGLPVTVFWFLGCMNAINLIDGLDGLAAGVVLFASGTLFMTSLLFGNFAGALLAVVLAGATLGFLILNFPPASVFLGDSGSLLLGFLVACVGLLSSQKSYTVVALLIPVIALGLPIMDTTLAILRRWSKALPVSASDRQHIHHKLLEMGLGHRNAVLAMYGGCLILAAAALLMTAASSLEAAVLLGGVGLITFLAVRILARHEVGLMRRSLESYVHRRRRRLRSRTAGYTASTRMRHASSVAALWQAFGQAAQGMDLDDAELVLGGLEGPDGAEAERHRWSHPGRAQAADDDVLWSATYPLSAGGRRVGRLRVSKATDGEPLGPEVPETLELLGKALAINLSRVQGDAATAASPPPDAGS